MMTPPTAPPQACPICGGPLTDAVCPPCIKQAVLDCISTALAELPPPFGVTARSLATVRRAIVDALMFSSVTERTSRLLQFWEEATIRAATRMPSVSATYVSVWDGGTTVRVRCRWSITLQVAFEIDSVDVDGLDSLDREYVELEGGIEIDVDSQAETPDGIPARAVELGCPSKFCFWLPRPSEVVQERVGLRAGTNSCYRCTPLWCGNPRYKAIWRILMRKQNVTGTHASHTTSEDGLQYGIP
jgi:hypothetical protein